jgi:hypothetical protein
MLSGRLTLVTLLLLLLCRVSWGGSVEVAL